MKPYLYLVPVLLLAVACSDGPKVVTKSDEKPEVLAPDDDVDGHQPFTPENAIALTRNLLESEKFNSLFSDLNYSSGKMHYIGGKDLSNKAVQSTEKENFKKFLTEELNRMESEYPQYTKFKFSSPVPAYKLTNGIGQAVEFNPEHHHNSNFSPIGFRQHPDLKWALAGKEDAEKEQAAETLKAYGDEFFVVNCYGRASYTDNYNVVFDLTRCDGLGPDGKILVSTASN